VVLGFWGIFYIMAIGFGIAGLNLQKKNDIDRKMEKIAAIAGIVIGAIWLVVQIYFAVIRYMNA
jgi:hypothetical protein